MKILPQRWWLRLAWLALVAPLTLLPVLADTFLQVPPVAPVGERVCPGTTRVVIPFRTGPQISHVTRVVFPQVAQPATGGWNSPTVFCGITANPDGYLEQNSQRFRYTQPVAGAAVADVVFDRPYWGVIDTLLLEQPGGAGLAADTDYFIVLNFGADVANGLHSGWCLAPGATDSVGGAYTLLPPAGASVPAVTIDGVIHLPAPEQGYRAFPPGEGPSVAGVVWGQRGEGAGWTGAGNQAVFNAPGKVPSGNFNFPPSPPPWRSIEATVQGPGVFSFSFSGPVLARGGREPDYAVCSLWIDGIKSLASIPAGAQILSLGPGPHQLLWVPEMGPNAMHMNGNSFVANFTLSNLYFGQDITLADALDAAETTWTPVGVWQPRSSGPSEDWAESDFPYSAAPVPCFSAPVTGPGKLVLTGRLFVSYQDMQLWYHRLETDGSSRFRVSIDGQPAHDVAAGTHHLDIPAGSHELVVSVVTVPPSGAFPSNKGLFHAEIATLQYVPAQPASYAAWLEANDLPPTTPPANDADGNGVSAWMEWAAGLTPGSFHPLLSLADESGDLVLTAPRNRSASVVWRLEEMVPPGPWQDVTSQFSADFVTETTWRARRNRGDRPTALYRLQAIAW